jgi:hypothetical protein
MEQSLFQVINFMGRVKSVEELFKKPKSKDKDTKKKSNTSSSSGNKKKPTFFCSEHGPNFTHDTKDCKVLAAKKSGNWSNKKKPFGNKTWTRKAEENSGITKKELAALVQKAAKKEFKKQSKELASISKKQKSNNSSSDKDDDDKECFLLKTLTNDMEGFNYKDMEDLKIEDDADVNDKVSCWSQGEDVEFSYSDKVENNSFSSNQAVEELFALDDVSCSSPECSSSSEEEEYDSLDECLDAYGLAEYIWSQSNRNKRQRTGYVDKDMRPLAFVCFNTKLGKPAPVTIRALLDSGASELLINAKHVKHLRVKKKLLSPPPFGLHQLRRWKPFQGLRLSSPFLNFKILEWNLHVTENMGAYDMIIGRDIMNFFGINIQFSDLTVHWEHASMPFKLVDATIDTDYHIAEPMAVEDTTERIRNILDNKYQAIDLEKVCSVWSHLEYQQQQKLFDLLNKFSNLFDGTLGKWNHDPIKLELKEGATPYHAQPFPIPKCHAETLKMEVEQLVEIGVLKKVNRSEWAAPLFIFLKKDGTVRFINGFRELDKQIKRKPFQSPTFKTSYWIYCRRIPVCYQSRSQHGVLSHRALSRLKEAVHSGLSFQEVRDAGTTNGPMQ